MSIRKQRVRLNRLMQQRKLLSAREDELWERMAPVGREFGSPDFDRLMEEDYRRRVGVFDPATRDAFDGGLTRSDMVELPDDPAHADSLFENGHPTSRRSCSQGPAQGEDE